jgi:hypothetical protein
LFEGYLKQTPHTVTTTATDSIKNSLAMKLLDDFEEHWGASNQPVFNEVVRRGAYIRQNGILPGLVIAHFLDPHFKYLS